MKIDWSDEVEGADDSTRINREFNSNKLDENDLHNEKCDEQLISTLRGITIDRSEDGENADDSIRGNRESAAKIIERKESRHRENCGLIIEINCEIQARTTFAFGTGLQLRHPMD
jgi:hypothetical protein